MIASYDSVHVFNDVISPIIDTKCVKCHNMSKSKGGLMLASSSDILLGGENGQIIFANNSSKSKLYNYKDLNQIHSLTLEPNKEVHIRVTRPSEYGDRYKLFVINNKNRKGISPITWSKIERVLLKFGYKKTKLNRSVKRIIFCFERSSHLATTRFLQGIDNETLESNEFIFLL